MGQKNKSMGDIAIGARGQTASQNELRELVQKQQYCCALSGVSLSPAIAELDHIEPVAAGGTNAINNLQVLHRVVNRMKGTMSNIDFVTWCRLVAESKNISSGSLSEDEYW